jgi:DNA-binding transcriptional LysR family regulator
VRSGRSEIGLAELPIDEPGLASETLLTQELMVVLAPTSRLASRRRLRIEDLSGVPLVMTPAGTPMRRQIDAAFDAAGLSPSLAVETEHREAIGALVLAGAGTAILPGPLAAAAHAAGALTIPLSPHLRRAVGLIYRQGPQSPAAQAFLSIARTP